MRTGIKFFTVIALFFLTAPFLRAANVSLPDKIGDWTATGQAQAAKVDALHQPVWTESGYVNGQTREYQNGQRRVTLTLFVFRDSSGAYEAFTFMAANGPARLPFANGNLLLSFSDTIPQEDRKAFQDWTQRSSDHVTSPPIASYLPPHAGWHPQDRYALGPVGFRSAANDFAQPESLVDSAGFSSGAEAMWARYESGSGSSFGAGTLLLIDYPTPQLAELHLRHLQRALADAKLTTSSIERKGSLLSIVLAPTSPEYAAKLRAGVNYETQVTWNEASQTATDPPIMSTVAKIFIATGVFMVVTIVIGIAFGGVRIITKRLFPGKVFDRKNQIEVLQLGLTGKPIDPSDLY